jgi:hypothetical protein
MSSETDSWKQNTFTLVRKENIFHPLFITPAITHLHVNIIPVSICYTTTYATNGHWFHICSSNFAVGDIRQFTHLKFPHDSDIFTHTHNPVQPRNSGFVINQITYCWFPCVNTEEGKIVSEIYVFPNAKYAYVYNSYWVTAVRQTDWHALLCCIRTKQIVESNFDEAVTIFKSTDPRSHKRLFAFLDAYITELKHNTSTAIFKLQ